MKKWLLAATLGALVISLSGCAHESAGYAYGGGLWSDCELGSDCYGGPVYTCVLYEPAPASLPARLEINQASRAHGPRIVHPREPGTPSSDSSGASFSSASTQPAVPMTPAREPVTLVSAPSEGRTPHTRN
jgi:hypothetical protein